MWWWWLCWLEEERGGLSWVMREVGDEKFGIEMGDERLIQKTKGVKKSQALYTNLQTSKPTLS